MAVGSGCGKKAEAAKLAKADITETKTIIEKAEAVPKEAPIKVEFELTGILKTQTGEKIKFAFVGEALSNISAPDSVRGRYAEIRG